jgi:hypothetical protein
VLCPARRVLRLPNLPPPPTVHSLRVIRYKNLYDPVSSLFHLEFIVFASQFVARAVGCGTALHSVDSSASAF